MTISNSIKMLGELISDSECSIFTIHDTNYNIGLMWSCSENVPVEVGQYPHGFTIAGASYEISKGDFNEFLKREEV